MKLEKALLFGGMAPEYIPLLSSDQVDENGEIDQYQDEQDYQNEERYSQNRGSQQKYSQIFLF